MAQLIRAATLSDLDDEWEDDDSTRLWMQRTLAGSVLLGVVHRRFERAERRQPSRLYLCRAQLLPNPRKDTPWQKLLHSASDRAFITTMGFDIGSFDAILDAGFRDQWDTTPIPRNDVEPSAVTKPHRRSLDAEGALGLILHYLSSTMREITLQELFALTPSVVTRYLDFARGILLRTLRRMPEAQIKWPKGDEFRQYRDLIAERHPLLTGAFGFVDGLNLPVEVSSDEEIENQTYNGWLHSHFISSVFVFAPNGTILKCCINAPGSWHDAQVAMPIYDRLLESTPQGFYLVADTAFPRGPNSIGGRIKAPIKQGSRLPPAGPEQDQMMRFNNQLVSCRQAAEWGMRAIQGSFGRLRLPLPIDNQEKRYEILEVCSRLFNLRVRRVGISEIKNTFEPIWREADGCLWDNFDSMVFGEVRKRDRVSRFHLVAREE